MNAFLDSNERIFFELNEDHTAIMAISSSHFVLILAIFAFFGFPIKPVSFTMLVLVSILIKRWFMLHIKRGAVEEYVTVDIMIKIFNHLAIPWSDRISTDYINSG